MVGASLLDLLEAAMPSPANSGILVVVEIVQAQLGLPDHHGQPQLHYVLNIRG